MIPLQDLLIFAAAALLMVLTPGPNMIYLISRSISGAQGGRHVVAGCGRGFLCAYVCRCCRAYRCVSRVPMAYEVLKWAGALCLLWLYNRRGAETRRAFAVRSPAVATGFVAQTDHHGFLTSALNPKIAVFYLSVFPQFISPEHGSVFVQSLILGLTQKY